jgi:IclR family acetate operon transcriptional repressor
MQPDFARARQKVFTGMKFMESLNQGPPVIARKTVPSNSLDRALIVLQEIEHAPYGLTNAEVSKLLGIATSSASYVLSRLERSGLLSRTENGRYRIGLLSISLARAAMEGMGFLSMAEPALYRLVQETGLSASIGVLERGHILIVDRIESPKMVNDSALSADNLAAARRLRQRESRYIGRELPLHSNAIGKVILAHLDPEFALELLRRQGLPKMTPRTITSERQFMSTLELTRARGYSNSVQEQYMGTLALGVPIFDSGGRIRAAISLSGDVEQSRCEYTQRFVESLRAAATAISSRGRFRNHVPSS